MGERGLRDRVPAKCVVASSRGRSVLEHSPEAALEGILGAGSELVSGGPARLAGAGRAAALLGCLLAGCGGAWAAGPIAVPAPRVGEAPAPAAPVEAVAWMRGTWRTAPEGPDGGTVTVERWLPTDGDVTLGTSETTEGGHTTFFEYLRIEATGGALVYVAQPRGGPAVRFPATLVEPGRAVFENPAHDFPTRITYQREGEILVASIEGPGRDPVTWRMARTSHPPPPEAAHYEGPVIDVHAHVFFDGDGGARRDASPAGLVRQTKGTPGARVGVIVMALRPGIEETRRLNDRLTALVAEHPGHLFAIGTVHPADGADALRELERIAGLGFRMLKLHPNTQSLDLDGEEVSAVVGKAATLGLPILFDWSGVFAAADLGQYVKLAARHPDARIVLAHMGGTRFHDGMLLAALHEYAWYRGNLWVDLSAVARLYARSPYREQLLHVIRHIGVERVLFGSDYPFARTTAEALEDVRALGLTPDEERLILHDNAARLLGLGASAP